MFVEEFFFLPHVLQLVIGEKASLQGGQRRWLTVTPPEV
jgi:hypothetical protein